MDMVAGLAGNMFRGGGGEQFMDGGRDSGMVPEFDEAGDRSAELGVWPGVDSAVRAYGDCRVAGLDAGALSATHLGAGALYGATGVELCLVVDILSPSCAGGGAGGGSGFVGRDRGHYAGVCENCSGCGVVDGVLLGLGHLCERIE